MKNFFHLAILLSACFAPFCLISQQAKRLPSVMDSYPMYSPDGSRIVFQSNRTGNLEIFSSLPDGKDVRQLTKNAATDSNPIWSPDGSKVVFVSERAGNTEIYSMNKDGNQQIRLTDFSGDDSHPHWSPDGKKIIFNSARTTPDLMVPWIKQIHELFIMDADGKNVRQLTSFKSISSNPHFSPDGKLIAFRHFTITPGVSWSLRPSDGNSEIVVCDMDGKNLINLSNSPAYDTWPWWSPDGRYVLFSSNRDGQTNSGQLYIADSRGSFVRKLTDRPGSHVRASWSGSANKIILQQVWGDDERAGNLATIDVTDSLLMIAASPFAFKRISQLNVVLGGGLSRGVSTVDFNQDGWQDISVANSDMQGNPVYSNTGNNTFRQLFDNEIALSPNFSESMQWIDFDNDYDLDLFVTNLRNNKNFLFRNDSNKIFKLTSAGALTEEIGSTHTSCWCDADKDGDLDVFLVRRDDADDALFINEGNGIFKKTSKGPWIGNGGDGRTCAWGDINNDGWPDIFVGNYGHRDSKNQLIKHRNYLYVNHGSLVFDEVREGHAVTDQALTYGVSFVDHDNDSDLDLLVTNAARSDHSYLYSNDGNGNFEITQNDISKELYHPSKGHTWGDFDNDGDLDVYVATGTEGAPDSALVNLLYANEGMGKFTKVRHDVSTQVSDVSAATAWLDYDRDGDVDLYVTNWGGSSEDNELYSNESNNNRWVAFQLRGVESNSFGIGTKVSIMTLQEGKKKWQHQWMWNNTGYASQNPYELHFGLGKVERVESIEVIWPSGKKDYLTKLASNKIYKIKEGKGLVD